METKVIHPTPTPETVEQTRNCPVAVPETDIFETPEALLVTADLPGVSETDVNINLEDDILTITARGTARDPEGMECVRREFCARDYRRTFRLGADIDRARIAAQMSKGVLRLTLPKAEAARPRRIAVNAAP